MISFAINCKFNKDISEELKEVLNLGFFMIFMLILLVVMHAYWTVFIVKGMI